jgi:hypothetical protein
MNNSDAEAAVSPNPIERVALQTIFSSLSNGPRAVADMPRRWPVSRALLRLIARRLVATGFVQRGARGRLQLTALGWMRAAELARADG